jgi:hypothetical protein
MDQHQLDTLFLVCFLGVSASTRFRRHESGVNITVKNTTVVNDVDYLFSDLLHVSAHVRPSSGTLKVNYSKYTVFNIMRLTSVKIVSDVPRPSSGGSAHILFGLITGVG